MNHLHTLMKIAKAMKILSAIAKVFCIIGAIFSVFGVVGSCFLYSQPELCDAFLSDPAFEEALYEDIGLADYYGSLFLSNHYVLLNNLVNIFVYAFITCLVNFILAREAYICFNHLVIDGTPFSYRCAEEFKSLGWHEILFSVACAVICSVMESILSFTLGGIIPISSGAFAAIPAIGIFYLILAPIFRYGAFVAKNAEE